MNTIPTRIPSPFCLLLTLLLLTSSGRLHAQWRLIPGLSGGGFVEAIALGETVLASNGRGLYRSHDLVRWERVPFIGGVPDFRFDGYKLSTHDLASYDSGRTWVTQWVGKEIQFQLSQLTGIGIEGTYYLTRDGYVLRVRGSEVDTLVREPLPLTQYDIDDAAYVDGTLYLQVVDTLWVVRDGEARRLDGLGDLGREAIHSLGTALMVIRQSGTPHLLREDGSLQRVDLGGQRIGYEVEDIVRFDDETLFAFEEGLWSYHLETGQFEERSYPNPRFDDYWIKYFIFGANQLGPNLSLFQHRGDVVLTTQFGNYRSSDRGRSWTRIETQGYDMLGALYLAATGALTTMGDGDLCFGAQSGLFRADPQSPTWARTDRLDDEVANLLAPTFIGEVGIAAFSYRPQLHISDDGGVTWRPAPLPDDGPEEERKPEQLPLGNDGTYFYAWDIQEEGKRGWLVLWRRHVAADRWDSVARFDVAMPLAEEWTQWSPYVQARHVNGRMVLFDRRPMSTHGVGYPMMFFLSEDHGMSWRTISPSIDGAPITCTMYDVDISHDGSRMFVTSDSGAYYSFDRGQTWRDITETNGGTVFMQLGMIDYDDETGSLFAITLWGGAVVGRDNGGSWMFYDEGLPIYYPMNDSNRIGTLPSMHQVMVHGDNVYLVTSAGVFVRNKYETLSVDERRSPASDGTARTDHSVSIVPLSSEGRCLEVRSNRADIESVSLFDAMGREIPCSIAGPRWTGCHEAISSGVLFVHVRYRSGEATTVPWLPRPTR